MGDKTAISWTATHHEDGTVTPGATWNPLAGCVEVTEGCGHCYAATLHNQRYQAHLRGLPMPQQYHEPFSVIQLLPDRLDQPLRWRRPRKIFVNSMSDLFHSQVPEDYIRQVFEVMRRAHWHIFQVLTKRAGRLRTLGPRLEWPPNVWMGVSIELDQYCPRADALRCVPASIRFLSCEPLLGPLPSLNLSGISWVITGGESGPHFRTADPDWFRGIRDQCLREGVAFYHKQNGGRTPNATGRLLDGRTWDEYPPHKEEPAHHGQ